jgi:alanyl-tRNA synthetase
VEAYVNEVILAECDVKLEEISKIDAKNDSTIEASFWEKYPDIVKVYTFT